MEEQNDYQSYGSYLSRTFTVIVVIILLLLAVWFVVRIASDNNDEVESTETTSQQEESGSDVATNDNEVGDLDLGEVFNIGEVADESLQEQGQTLSTNTDDLPNTGPEDLAWIIALPALTYGVVSYHQSKSKLKKSINSL